MAERAYSADLARRVVDAVSGVDGVSVHPGFERIELSLRDSISLGFVDASGIWLDVGDEGGDAHPGRFGRSYRQIAGASELRGLRRALATAVARSERGDTWAALPVIQVSAGLYLGLMNGQGDAFGELRRVLARAKRREALWRLWEPQNWRPHMLACAAACLTGDATAIDTAWMAFDRFSWACPQLAVTLQRIDPDFAASAAARLDAADSSDEVWPRPFDRFCLDRKSRGALGALLGRAIGDGEEQGARLADSWKRAVEEELS